MKIPTLFAVIASLCTSLAGCVTEDTPTPPSDQQPGGKADGTSNEDLLLSCLATYRYVSNNALFEWEPRDSEIQVSIEHDVSTGIDTWRQIEADTDAFHYSVRLQLDTTAHDGTGDFLHYTITSKQTGASTEAFGSPVPFGKHGTIARLLAGTGQTFGTIQGASGDALPIVAAGLYCRISKVKQNYNLETSYPTLTTIP